MAKRPPLDEDLILFAASVAKRGVTTGAGAGAGTSIIDSSLAGAGANSFVDMLLIPYLGDFLNVESITITAFNNGTGEVTVAEAYKGVAAAIPAGVDYAILTFRFVAADVAALMADVGDASAATLGSILGILGNPGQTFLTMIGYEGATSLAAKLTAARATLLDQITAARMGELDAANIPADIDLLLTRVTAAVALASSLTTHDTDIKALLSTIAGYIDTEVAAILAAVDTEVASIKTQTDKLAGASPTVGSTVANYNAAEQDIVSIGANDTKNKLHSLVLNVSALTAAATITIRMYMQVNGVERKVYDQDFVVGTDPDGLWVVNGMVGIHEVLRVTAQSDNAGDDGKAIDYDYMLEVM